MRLCYLQWKARTHFRNIKRAMHADPVATLKRFFSSLLTLWVTSGLFKWVCIMHQKNPFSTFARFVFFWRCIYSSSTSELKLHAATVNILRLPLPSKGGKTASLDFKVVICYNKHITVLASPRFFRALSHTLRNRGCSAHTPCPIHNTPKLHFDVRATDVELTISTFTSNLIAV